MSFKSDYNRMIPKNTPQNRALGYQSLEEFLFEQDAMRKDLEVKKPEVEDAGGSESSQP
jgi:hypothetical protein